MKRSVVFSLLLLFTVQLLRCQDEDQPSPEVYQVLEPLAFERMIAADSSILLLDVRRPDEFEEDHIEGAENVNVLEPEAFAASMDSRDRDQTIMLYCRSGRRSKNAALKLEEMGFKKIFDLEGGFLAWQEKEEE